MDPRANLNNFELNSISAALWKELCKELRLRQSGRKDELRKRVVDYLSSEEGRRRVAEPICSALLQRVARLVGGEPAPVSHPNAAPANLAPSIQYTKRCLCGGAAQQLGLACQRCGNFQHFSCMGRAASMLHFECPLCQFRQMEPYEPIVEIVLPPSPPNVQGQSQTAIRFLYTEELSRKLSFPGRILQIRSIRLDEEGYAHHWPKECSVVINGKTVCSFSQPASTSARKRKDSAIVLQQFPLGLNEAAVVRQREDSYYAFGIFIVEKLSPDRVIASMSANAALSREAGKAFVRDRIGGTEEVVADSYRQSLKCPLTRLIPDTPARGIRCKHIQCFDLQPYIIMQEKAKANRWKCPVCNLLVLSVVVDLYMKEVVTEALQAGATLVEFSPTGGYSLVKEEDESDESEEENGFGAKRPAEDTAPRPVKRPALQPKLLWSDFVQSTGHSDCISLELLHGTVAYRHAYESSVSKRVAPRTSTLPPVRELGKSMDCPIEIDD